MITVRKVIVFSTGAVGAMMILFFAYTLASRGIYVSVANFTSKPVRTVRLLYKGGEFCVPDLEPGQTIMGTIYPLGETDLSLYVEQAEGKVTSEKIDVYLEPGYRGRVDISITDQGITFNGRVFPSLIR
jgi:hypothetical protein